jgi:RNA polymerase sigma-70 factor (ECF subfamily)
LALSRRRRLQARERRELLLTGWFEEALSAGPETPYEEALSRRRRDSVLRLLDAVSEPVAEVMAMHYMLGHTVEDISIALGISPNTVWSRLRLGKRALMRKIERDAALAEAVRLTSDT